MDEVHMAAGAILVLAMALGGAVGWLVGGSRRARQRRWITRGYLHVREEAQRRIHRFRGQGEAVTVAELLEEAVEEGHGLRLNWPQDDLLCSPIRPDDRGQFPTVVLPRIGDDSA